MRLEILLRTLLGALTLAVALSVAGTASAAKNVIIMIADGSGHQSWRAASMYQGQLGKQVYDGPRWVKLACSTYPLNMSTKPTGGESQDAALVYDAAKYWDTAPQPVQGGGCGGFAGYNYAKLHYTDSAAAATALASGCKTFNNAINWTNDDHSLTGRTISELAKAAGKSCGVITSVPWSHATPAGLGGAHNVSRNAYAEIAVEMLAAPYLDVIMGAGHPAFDDDGQPLKTTPTKKQYAYVGGEATWQSLKSGQHPAGWKLIERKADFEALANGPTPAKVVGTAEVATTLQVNRGKKGGGEHATGSGRAPFQVPPVANVPSLATMTKAAIHCLEGNPKGFYLMIEGGAVDWANHANDGPRMIEEQVDYVRAVEAVAAWVETHGGWDETLLILTADHETGMLWGPQSDTVAFQPIVDGGAGQMPGLHYNSKAHTNSLVPLYACGPGSARFAALVRGEDPKAAAAWQTSGRYVTNIDVFAVMKEQVSPAAGAPTSVRASH